MGNHTPINHITQKCHQSDTSIRQHPSGILLPAWSVKERSTLSLVASAAQTTKKMPLKASTHGTLVPSPTIHTHIHTTARMAHHRHSLRRKVPQRPSRTRKASPQARQQSVKSVVDVAAQVGSVDEVTAALDAEVRTALVVAVHHGLAADSHSVALANGGMRTRRTRAIALSSPRPMSSTPRQPT